MINFNFNLIQQQVVTLSAKSTIYVDEHILTGNSEHDIRPFRDLKIRVNTMSEVREYEQSDVRSFMF